MKPGAIYRKVMIFNRIRLGIGFLNIIIGMLIIGGAYLIITNFAFDLLTNIAIGCGAFLLIVIIYYLMMSRMGYGIRIGQLAVTERANSGHEIPQNPIEYSKNIVSERFGSSRRFYLYSRDISIAVKQFMRVISRGFTINSDTPDFGTSRRLLMLLSHTAIVKADDCCMAYALRRRDYELNAACVDALTILAQKWDAFFRRAFRLSLFIIAGCLILFFIFYLPGLAVSRSLSVSSFPWMGCAFLLTLSSKIVFFDSWAQTKMVCEFLNISEDTEIDPSIYQKLDSWSSAYANLRKNAQKASDKADKQLTSGNGGKDVSENNENDTGNDDGGKDVSENNENDTGNDSNDGVKDVNANHANDTGNDESAAYRENSSEKPGQGDTNVAFLNESEIHNMSANDACNLTDDERIIG